MEALLKLDDVCYEYKNSGHKTLAVKNANAEFMPGKVYAITGRSGAGKSTLLSLIAGLDMVHSGEILFAGQSLGKIDRDLHRSKNIGIVFQSFNLLTHFTALENVLVAIELSSWPARERKDRALKLLARVGISETMARRKVLKLSGGEQQRVAIARALGPNPPLILADEPTGNLDSETGEQVMDLLCTLAHQDNHCVIVITHSQAVARRADAVLSMQDGYLATS